MNQYSIYRTIQGDTFDSIALKLYGNEFKSIEIINANPDYSHIVEFPEGTILQIPVLSEEANTSLPPWKR